MGKKKEVLSALEALGQSVPEAAAGGELVEDVQYEDSGSAVQPSEDQDEYRLAVDAYRRAESDEEKLEILKYVTDKIQDTHGLSNDVETKEAINVFLDETEKDE